MYKIENQGDSDLAQLDLMARMAAMEDPDRFADDEIRAVRNRETGRIVQHPDYGSDESLNVTFFSKAILSKRLTLLAQDRAIANGDTSPVSPQYADVDYVKIVVPGAPNLTHEAPVTDFYQWRFPNEYKLFRDGKSAVASGTPIELWASLNPSEVATMQYHGIRTVEQIANLSDSVSGVLRSFHSLKHKAKQFLEDAKSATSTSVVRAELESQKSAFDAQMKVMQEQMAAMAAALEATKAPKKAKGPSEPTAE